MKDLTPSRRKTLAKYRALIDDKSAVWTKQNISGFASLLRKGMLYGWDKAYEAHTRPLWFAFICQLNTFPLDGYPITEGQSRQGISWLNKTLFRQDGSRRQTKTTQYLGDSHFEIVRNFTHFTFVGFHFSGRHLIGPVYRVHAKGNRSFDYCISGQWGPMIVDDEIELNAA